MYAVYHSSDSGSGGVEKIDNMEEVSQGEETKEKGEEIKS